MIYLVSGGFIVVAFFIGKHIGYTQSESEAEKAFGYFYKMQSNIYDEAYRKGVAKGKATE